MKQKTDELLLMSAKILTTHADLDGVEANFGIDLNRPERLASGPQDPAYYLQFPAKLRSEAESMGRHYETLYCLENSIRDLVTSQMLDNFGEGWWDNKVPLSVTEAVAQNRKREAEAGISLRSPDNVDYTTFGELLVIIESNWPAFSDIFNNQKAVRRVLSGLNTLRAPIAHCASLAPDEITRLELAIKDYYRLME